MHRVTSADGTPIAYARAGSGPPLLLVHGIVSDHRTLEGLSRRLTEAFTVLSIERRGRGESGAIGDAGLDEQHDDVIAVAEAMNEPCHVFAHSLGAWAALGAAARSPQIQSLTLYEPPPLTPVLATLAGRLDSMVEAGDRDAAVTTLLQGLGANAKMIARLEQTPIWSSMTSLATTLAPELRMLAAADVERLDLPELTTPVLLLRGSKTPSMVRDVCDALAEVLRSGRVSELHGQDHFAPVFAPAAVEAPLLDFIRAV